MGGGWGKRGWRKTSRRTPLPKQVFDPLRLRSRRPATGVCRALRARSVPGVSPRVSPKMGGVRGSVRRGVPGALRAPGSGVSKKCPKSVPGVSKRCPGHSGHTLFGHSGARGPKGPGDTPSDTPPDTPHFRGHSQAHSGTLRTRRARETPVAGRRDRNPSSGTPSSPLRCRCFVFPVQNFKTQDTRSSFQGALKGTNLRGQTEPKRRFSLIFADFCRFSPFPRKRSIRRKPQIFAGNRRNPQKTAENRTLAFVPLGSSP